jgi:hydrogenase maturation protease
MENLTPPHIMVLGIGNILFTDEGFGVRVVEELQQRYAFAGNVSIVDGGVLGVNLMGVISSADYLIVVDAVRNKGAAGDLYRLESHEIPERIRLKNSLHQIDFLEALTLCQALDKVPETIILGVEPQDIESLCVDLSPLIQSKIEPMLTHVLLELERLGATYTKKE